MSPRNIVTKANEAGLDIIAVTDHNMVENALYAYEIGKKNNLLVLPGMELQTVEEIHLLALFGDNEVALEFQKKVYASLPSVKNNADYFGDQVVADENDEIIRFEDKLLLNSAQISLDDAVSMIKEHDGLVIPSHIDSSIYSIVSQLGYVPENLPVDALEITDRANIPLMMPFILNKTLPFVTFSDAHYVQDIGKKRTYLELEEPTFEEVVKALLRMRGNERKGSDA
jgi:predicted metal-dependent phosphoesterase TrpH